MTEASWDCGLVPGTPVLTPTGPVPVEALEPGRMVLAVSGTAAPFQAVVAVNRLRAAGPFIRIRAEALDDGTPQQDLVLPAAHGVLINGGLVPAGSLADGHGIIAEEAEPGLALVQLVLAGHDAVLAAGVAVETCRPGADAPDCAPRGEPDGALRALLSWRAEQMGWVAAELPDPDTDADPGSLRERLESSPLAAALPPTPRRGDAEDA